MIHPHEALLRHAQDFFRSDLIGLYRWDNVQIGDLDPVPSENRRERHQGRYYEQARLVFGPWEILLYSSTEKPPLGEVQLRDNAVGGAVHVSGSLDAATWGQIAKRIRAGNRQRFLG